MGTPGQPEPRVQVKARPRGASNARLRHLGSSKPLREDQSGPELGRQRGPMRRQPGQVEGGYKPEPQRALG